MTYVPVTIRVCSTAGVMKDYQRPSARVVTHRHVPRYHHLNTAPTMKIMSIEQEIRRRCLMVSRVLRVSFLSLMVELSTTLVRQ